MSASGIAYHIQAAQGWTDATLLDLVLDYINNQGSDDAFADYLAERAEDEPGSGHDEQQSEPLAAMTARQAARAGGKGTQVAITLGTGQIHVGRVDVDQEPDNDPLRAAAVAWSAIARNGSFTAGDRTFTAAECAEWWA